METRKWIDDRIVGILRTLVLVIACFGSAAIGASFTAGEAQASVPDYMRTICDRMRDMTSELKDTNRHLKDIEDAIERIQREYTK